LPSERSAAEAALRAWADEHDKPVTVERAHVPVAGADGVGEQHPGRTAATSPVGRDAVLVDALELRQDAARRKPDPIASEAWATLDKWVADAQAQLPVGENLPTGTKSYWADVMAKRVPAFQADLKLSRQILADRMPQLAPIKQSPNHELWTELLGAASTRYKQLIAAGWSKTDAADQWRRNDVPQLQAWVDTHPGFAKEVSAYGATFLASLVRR
jgi:hypothetical protein